MCGLPSAVVVSGLVIYFLPKVVRQNPAVRRSLLILQLIIVFVPSLAVLYILFKIGFDAVAGNRTAQFFACMLFPVRKIYRRTPPLFMTGLH